ncbi:MAG: LOG family protein [Roseiarcus sp.]|jgi:uncharacterized protein (TIGR00730 family)
MTDLAPANAAQVASSAYRLAALDQDFLLGDSTRGVRFQLEYQKAQEALRRFGVASTLVVFGSSRVRQDGPGRQSFWYAEARAFGRLASLEGGAARGGPPFPNVVATGGGPGAMEAANRGAFEAGAPTIGFNITLPREQEPNRFTTPALTFRFHYFAMRKMHFAMGAKALVVFPGGFGTFDELFELVTLVQSGKAPAMPIVLVDEGYWRRVVDWNALAEAGMIGPQDLDLVRFAGDAADAWRCLKAAGIAADDGRLPPAQDRPGNLPLGEGSKRS